MLLPWLQLCFLIPPISALLGWEFGNHWENPGQGLASSPAALPKMKIKNPWDFCTSLGFLLGFLTLPFAGWKILELWHSKISLQDGAVKFSSHGELCAQQGSLDILLSPSAFLSPGSKAGIPNFLIKIHFRTRLKCSELGPVVFIHKSWCLSSIPSRGMFFP